MQKKIIIRCIILILIVIWMLTVFYLSNQNGDESGGLSEKIARILIHDENKAKKIEPYIRKLAHLSEYACGGILFLSLFLTYDFSEIKRIIFSTCLSIEYATLDEIHQLFIDGRAGQIIDVFIDTIGALIGIYFAMIIIKIVSRKLNKRKEGVEV